MSEQPEALRLAEVLDLLWMDGQTPRQAAAELRRLVAEHEEDQSVIAVWRGRTQRAEAQRDALLEKIKAVIAAEQSEGSGRGWFVNTPPTREHQRRVAQAWQELHAAIKAVEECK